ncbi:hypothetical protein TNCT_404261 [Trichonephila clavata]|uniref:Uncharacterized protein n=1 Tax=Trichonephila clavata TaxID=2740835 RepID=A0A8X6HC33_TRICU|nr:hypothetical protein TNCT_404261 [Trichonephila clavata]
MHPSTTKQWFKTVMIFKDFDEQHEASIRQAVLRPLVGIRIARDTEKVLFTPSPATVDFVFQQSSTPCLFRQSMLQTCQWTS